MPRTVIDIAGFETKFKANPDPWNYQHSRFEAFKRGVLMQACGSRAYGRGLELACANGVTTRLLASRCIRLLALDGSQTAVERARVRTSDLNNVVVQRAILPREMAAGPFDLIVISELLYYLSTREVTQLLRAVAAALAPGGRVVVLHHIVPFDDVAISPAAAQEQATLYYSAIFNPVFHRALCHFDVAAFARPLK